MVEGVISERWDRFLANSSWFVTFPFLKVQHGVAAYSDHIPLWLDTNGGLIRRRGERPFRFKTMWVGDKECSGIVERAWNGGAGVVSLSHIMGIISTCSTKLKRWKKNCFINVQKELASAIMKLKEIQELDPSYQQSSLHKSAREDVHKWLERDEVMWKQRSRVVWLKEGDSNSRFFHHKANARRRKNRILQLQDEYGNWRRGDQMDDLMVGLFQNLFIAATRIEMNGIL